MHDSMSTEIPIIKKQILLVEDESVFANAVRKHLLRKEYDISLANDLKSARQYIKENIPDLILLDMRLPDGSGLDLVALGRRTHHRRRGWWGRRTHSRWGGCSGWTTRSPS